MTTTNTLPTNNEMWGLYGTAEMNEMDPDKTWNESFERLAAFFEGCDPVDIRNLLDSRHGRHLADALTYMTMDKIIVKWRRWLVGAMKEVQANREAFETDDF